MWCLSHRMSHRTTQATSQPSSQAHRHRQMHNTKRAYRRANSSTAKLEPLAARCRHLQHLQPFAESALARFQGGHQAKCHPARLLPRLLAVKNVGQRLRWDATPPGLDLGRSLADGWRVLRLVMDWTPRPVKGKGARGVSSFISCEYILFFSLPSFLRSLCLCCPSRPPQLQEGQ